MQLCRFPVTGEEGPLQGVLAHRAGRPGPFYFLNPNPFPNPKPPLLPIVEPHIAALDKTKKFGDILTQYLKLNFNIDTTFPDRDSTAIFNFYDDKTDSQQPQMTQTAPQEEHTIDTTMDETDAATCSEIRQKRRISDGMEDSKLLMDNKYATYVKLYRNYEDSSPIPDNPTKDWFAKELDKDQDNDKGLKLFTQDLDHQTVEEMLRRRRALFLHTKINLFPGGTDRPTRHILSTQSFQSQHLYQELSSPEQLNSQPPAEHKKAKTSHPVY
ncbi:hypothetical protein FHG87_009140 [Trinorchestia longiramus]|nr:hypothetical protein FHG87_009140 [Trinorchestia longiramus]